jgi:ABC-2 type transport system ATP-binding protein
LQDAGDRVVGGYSGGMRRRLDIAMSLIARPSVLFLDEPTTGLDPRSRLDVWALMEELVCGGTTTLLTTQYLDEADRLADEIAVIDRGVVIARGTADELKRQVGGDQIEILLEDVADAARVIELVACHSCDDPHIDGEKRRVLLPVPDLSGMVPQVVRDLDHAGIQVRDVAGRRSTLDDVFFALTGHTAEEVAEDGEGGEADAQDGDGRGEGTERSGALDQGAEV